MKNASSLFFVWMVLFCLLLSRPSCFGLVLSQDGKTGYEIVCASDLSASEVLSARELSGYLQRITGAEFPVIESAEKAESVEHGRIFVGFRSPDDQREMASYERRVKSLGQDIYLAGDGRDGDAFAVYDFLEQFLGCKFYTMRGVELIPANASPSWDALDYSIVPSFPAAYLSAGTWALNMDEVSAFERRARIYIVKAGLPRIGPDYSHVPGKLIPPGEKYKKQTGLWKPYRISVNDAYFGEHPEYFALNPQGKRVADRQLCYSNPEVRALMDAKLEQIIREEYQGGEVYLRCDLNDDNGFDGKTICCCDECMKLVQKYDSPAGPYWDYFLELAQRYEQEHPEIVLVTTAYHTTEKPPVGVARMPRNILMRFCPLNKDYMKPYDAPSNSRIIQRLNQWNALNARVKIQLYPSVYPRVTTILPLVANLRQLAQNLRIAYQYGVVGIDGEQGFPWHNVNGFNEIRQYMLSKLLNDVTLDENSVIADAMHFLYGAAGEKMIAFWQELEDLEASEKVGLMYTGHCPGTFSYLTEENLLRWSHDFDEMEALVANDKGRLNAVRDARVSLDEAILSVNFRLSKRPEFAPKELSQRIHREIARSFEERPHREGVLDWKKFSTYVLDQRLANGAEYFEASCNTPKPFEGSLQGFQGKVLRALPTRLLSSQTSEIHHLVPDADAPLGYAMKCNRLKLPKAKFMTMVYYEPSSDRFFAVMNNRVEIPMEELEAHRGVYRTYYVASTRLWPQCSLSLFHVDDGGLVPLGQFFDSNQPLAEYDMHVTIKVDEEGALWIAQVVLVRRNAPPQPQKIIPAPAG